MKLKKKTPTFHKNNPLMNSAVERSCYLLLASQLNI